MRRRAGRLAQDGKARQAQRRNRRGLLLLGAAALLVMALPELWQRLAPEPEALPIAGLPGFERRESGPVTARLDPFIGIPDPDRILPAEVPPAEICDALFGDLEPSSAVPVAMFTDVNCPYCRPMEEWLSELDSGSAAVTWHQLPLLGAESRAAARAILAAEAQGAGTEMRSRLHRSRFAPDAAYLSRLAAGMELDPERLLTDMADARTEAEIAQTLGLADLLGIAGTPAIVVGRTLVVGAMSRADFDTLLRRESERRTDAPCP